MFFDKLKKECAKKGVDVTPFLISLDMSAGSISAWKGGSEPRNSTKKKIADALGVDVSVFADEPKIKIASVETTEGEILKQRVYKKIDNASPEKLVAVLIVLDNMLPD